MTPGMRAASGLASLAAFVFASATLAWARPEPVARSVAKRATAPSRVKRNAESVRRLETPRGIVYVYWPRNYNKKDAGIVIYVHGYATTIDRAWAEHDLQAQFRASRRNALFLAPASPTENADEVKYPSYKALLKTVARYDVAVPAGPVVLAGHSGGFRSVATWIDRRVTDVILLDGLYGRESAFEDFIKQRDKRLLLVSKDTRDKTIAFCRTLPFAVTRTSVPESDSQWRGAERRARLLHLHSQFEHTAMIQGGAVLPLLLKLTSLRRLQ
jgi:hypothetical protein